MINFTKISLSWNFYHVIRDITLIIIITDRNPLSYALIFYMRLYCNICIERYQYWAFSDQFLFQVHVFSATKAVALDVARMIDGYSQIIDKNSISLTKFETNSNFPQSIIQEATGECSYVKVEFIYIYKTTDWKEYGGNLLCLCCHFKASSDNNR